MGNSSEYQDFHYSAKDGLRLHARIYEAAGGGFLPVICLPGLTRNARDFHELALYLANHGKRPRRVVSFDYRGRGGSQYDRDWNNYNVMVEADDVLAGMVAMGIEHAAFIGTSRGGLIMHVLAAMRPGAMKAGILNDVGPVVDGAGLALIRSYLERAPKPRNWEEAFALQKAAAKETFPALGDADIERLVRALYRDSAGKPVADYDPKLLKTLTSVDLSKPLPEFWPQFVGLTAMPLMVIRGENSSLLSEETVRRMREYDPDLVAHTVPGQGHAPLLETAGLPELISGFLAKVEAKR